MDVATTTFVLVHSPLVGPLTWTLVAEGLQRQGIAALVPTLTDAATDATAEDSEAHPPVWQMHVACVEQALASVPSGRPLVLVAHSGAAVLLPAIRERLAQPVAAYVFVDAGLPHHLRSRFDDLPEVLRAPLRAGERFPEWTDADLLEAVPDASLRHTLLAELHPRPLAFFTEPLPVFTGWPDAPGAYLQFTASYDSAAQEAQSLGWAYRHLRADHFHMLVNPEEVTAALLALVAEATSPS
jgi:hypothetical protein